MANEKENKRPSYEAPQIQTDSSEKIFEVLGPAVAGYGDHRKGRRGGGGGIMDDDD